MAAKTASRNTATPEEVLASIVEPRRKAARMSLRTAGDRAGMSEGTWRQLVANGVKTAGQWVPRYPRRDQVLAMAAAVDALEEAAAAMEAAPEEVEEARNRVNLTDPAEEEIMRMRHLRPAERLALIQRLQELRGE